MAIVTDPSPKPRLYLYDSTLRDGAQSRGVDFSVSDKRAISTDFDRFGLDYIEGGWPGANPRDDAFFASPPSFQTAKLVAFGMTRRPCRRVSEDPGLQAVLASKAAAVCLVGKSWDFQVEVALGTTREENLAMIKESISEAATVFDEVLFDAEHFFDGYKANPDYGLLCLETAYKAGARWVVLCDTNGGTLPHEVEAIISRVKDTIPGDHLGIHAHNDTDNATANSLCAVRAGVRQVQGTFNGLGERCGNANLASILPNLVLKMGFETGVDEEALTQLTSLSRRLDERLNRAPDYRAPYVGESAFAHKGGLHVSAMTKDPRSYEHITPESVGNRRNIVVSDQAGRANIVSRLHELGLTGEDKAIDALVEKIKALEFEGYSYDAAAASFELLARRHLQGMKRFYRLMNFCITDERHGDSRKQTAQTAHTVTRSQAAIELEVKGKQFQYVAQGNGPVNALDGALRQALIPAYPCLGSLELIDYKVRILTPNQGTRAVTRVMIESRDSANRGLCWTTVGVSTNVIDASYIALDESIHYKLQADLT